MSSLKSKLAVGAKHLGHQLNTPLIPRKAFLQNVPFVGQWQSRELIKDILDGRMRARDDSKWRQSGARNRTEYEKWSWAVCGMACLKMILDHRSTASPTLISMGKTCLKYGGYKEPLEASKGLQYYPFLSYIYKEFGLTGAVFKAMVPRDIKVALASRNYAIVSVNPQLYYPETTPKKRGGHLVLIVGYDDTKKEFYYHNPSGITPQTQEYAMIKYNDFKKFFANRGMVIKR